MNNLFPFQVIEESLEIAAPVATVFERWTQFEKFPEFMEGVAEVKNLGDQEFYWRGEFAGQMREWKSRVTVVIPSRRVAWRTTSSGAHSSRVVCVEGSSPEHTRVTVKMLIDPRDSWAQSPTPEQISQRVRATLRRLKTILESQYGSRPQS